MLFHYGGSIHSSCDSKEIELTVHMDFRFLCTLSMHTKNSLVTPSGLKARIYWLNFLRVSTHLLIYPIIDFSSSCAKHCRTSRKNGFQAWGRSYWISSFLNCQQTQIISLFAALSFGLKITTEGGHKNSNRHTAPSYKKAALFPKTAGCCSVLQKTQIQEVQMLLTIFSFRLIQAFYASIFHSL